MQQLFTLMSKLLPRKNPNLSIRHYKVVPLSQDTGVIEFVNGSIAIQNYLYRLNAKGVLFNCAHARYYKDTNQKANKIDEIFTRIARQYHSVVRQSDDKKKELIDTFSGIRSNFKPAFHFFFIEKFPNPGDWFVSRLRYCRHTATNSMVGYILGIGDRHLNNILIDEKTGEIIHIDLGIAFDQGKALKISEIVPFRLTNEIIDGMGWMGKDGVFRKTCEESLLVLRENSEYLLTVLNVFINDPLYTWKFVPKNQSSELALIPDELLSNNDGNKFAESAIITCQRKLDGRETGQNLSIEGQVSKLINEATSDENLALMFWGWKPFL